MQTIMILIVAILCSSTTLHAYAKKRAIVGYGWGREADLDTSYNEAKEMSDREVIYAIRSVKKNTECAKTESWDFSFKGQTLDVNGDPIYYFPNESAPQTPAGAYYTSKEDACDLVEAYQCKWHLEAYFTCAATGEMFYRMVDDDEFYWERPDCSVPFYSNTYMFFDPEKFPMCSNGQRAQLTSGIPGNSYYSEPLESEAYYCQVQAPVLGICSK